MGAALAAELPILQFSDRLFSLRALIFARPNPRRLKPAPLLCLDQFLLEAFGFEMCDERVDERTKLAVHHFRQLV
jgi:hypothetical protein